MTHQLSEIRQRALALIREAKLDKLGPGPLYDEWRAIVNGLLSGDDEDLDAVATKVVDLAKRVLAKRVLAKKAGE